MRQREAGARASRSRAVLAALVLFYAVLGLLVLAPEAVYSGDIGVKYVQAWALAAHGFRTLDIPYPGAFLDPAREFFPLRAPFVMVTGGSTQTIFSPAAAVLQALGVSVAGFLGFIVVSVVAAAAILYSAWKLSPPQYGTAVLVALGLASPLWFYAVSGWEHAPAVAFGAAGFAWGVRSRSRFTPLVAGLLVGAGATLRDEVLLMAPGLLVVVWLRTHRLRPLAAFAGGLLIPLALAATMEVWWFHRPVAAHLRHAVHLAQTAIGTTDTPDPEIPVLQAFTLRERYEAVVQYWLLGYGTDWIIALVAGGLAVALAVQLRWKSSIAVLAWLTIVVAFAARDLHELIVAPKWLAGLHRVSPYLVFALLPLPANAADRGWLRPAIALAAAAYLLGAFVGVDTSGGKSLGPRLLLPLFPILTVSAIVGIAAYLRAGTRPERWIGRAGVLLVCMSIAMHVCGTIRAYYFRNHDDAAAMRAIAAWRGRVVVADDPFTAQLLFPLYHRKIILLADSPELGTRLGTLLAEQRVADALVVSRNAERRVSLTPLHLAHEEQRGRMLIQYWRR